MDLNDNIFRNLLYDYLKKSGLSNTAESLQNEAQITGQIPPDFDGLLYGFCGTLCKMNNSGSSSQSQPPSYDPIMDTTPRIMREGYYAQTIASLLRGVQCQTLNSCDFSSDGKFVASAGQGEGGKPFVYNMETNIYVTMSATVSNPILDVRFQPGSNIFATSSYANTVKLWNAETLETVFDFDGHNGTVISLDFHPSEGILCSSDNQNVIKVWDLNRPMEFKEFQAGGSKVRFQPRFGTLLAVANKNVINILDFENFNVQKCFQGHVKDICSICWDFTGSWIASASEDDVRVWSLMTDKCVYQYQCSKVKKFKSIIFHPRYSDVLVIGSSEGLEMLVIQFGGLHIYHVSSTPTIGLAACKQNELIAAINRDSEVDIWK